MVCKTKRDKLTEYFEFHPHQPETTKFNATNVKFRPDDSGGRLQQLWLSYCEEKEALFCNLCIAYGTTTNSNQNPNKFLSRPVQFFERSFAAANIDVSKCISDITDGASNMSGQYNGFTAFFEKESPGHIHTWCYAHVLNLALCDVTTTNHASISLSSIVVQKVGVFFWESYLRMDMWKKQMSQRHGHDTQSRLNLIGATINR